LIAVPSEVIFNADDFGRSPGINAGILATHERGVVTSASLMVRWPAVGEAAAWARAHPSLDLGLHLDLGEWALRDGAWEPLYEVVPLDEAGAVDAELRRQLATFQRLVGRDPTHLDSHQHVHLHAEPVRRAASEVAADLGIPLRGACLVAYRGDFYGQDDEGSPLEGVISVEGLEAILGTIGPGVTELSCHPAYSSPPGAMYGPHARGREVRVLCDPRVRDVLARRHIALRGFAGLAGSPVA
jgi:predicted glycoside hydrolase/deacetylase ChbG (UPF0249 family)